MDSDAYYANGRWYIGNAITEEKITWDYIIDFLDEEHCWDIFMELFTTC